MQSLLSPAAVGIVVSILFLFFMPVGVYAEPTADPSEPEAERESEQAVGDPIPEPDDDPEPDLSAGDEGDDEVDHEDETEGIVEPAESPAVEEKKPRTFPKDHGQRIHLARSAFQNSDFDILRPLLEPLLEPEIVINDDYLLKEARELWGVGLFFEAQQVPDAQRRARLLDGARRQFLDLLRQDPEYVLDSLIFPASVVEVFEDVRQDNRVELQAILAARQTDIRGPNGLDARTIYIEREVQSNLYLLNFAPFGLGQFQNRAQIKGTLFAVGQVLALALNITSYWMIEHLRGSDGRFEVGTNPNEGPYARARGWQQVQRGSLVAFGAFYTWSVVDAVIFFEPYSVHIRTLDRPPAELEPGGGTTAGIGQDLGIGWRLRFRW